MTDGSWGQGPQAGEGWAAPTPSIPVGEIETTTPPRKHRTGIAVVGFLAVVVLIAGFAAVGFSASTTRWAASPAFILSSAAARTTGSGTAQFSSKVILTVDGQTQPAIDISGATDFASKRSAITLSAPNGTVIERVRSIGGVVYVSADGMSLPNGATWVSITRADLGVNSALSSNLGQTDPTSGLQFLSAVNGDPHIVGTQHLDGVDVTDYRFTIDFTEVTKQLAKANTKLGANALAEGISKLGSLLDLAHLPAEAWIDDQGRVHRFQVTFAVTHAGSNITVVQETRYSHFGERVTVQVPDPSQTDAFSQVPDFLRRLTDAITSHASSFGSP